MGILSGAIPNKANNMPQVHSQKGMHNAFFVGMTTPYEWQSTFPGDTCRMCQGTRVSKLNPQMPCVRCGGTGSRTDMRTKLMYQLENGVTEEEEVTYKLSPPSSGVKNGVTTTYSPSTLYLRLREFSGIQNPTEEQLDLWYTGLIQPIRIPVVLLIGDNKTNTALKIVNVQLRGAVAAAPAYANAPQVQQYYPQPPQMPPPPGAYVPQQGQQGHYAGSTVPMGQSLLPQAPPEGYHYDQFGNLTHNEGDDEIPF